MYGLAVSKESRTIAATPLSGGTRFSVWSTASRIELLVDDGPSVELTRDDDGWFCAHVNGVGAGARYRYRVDGQGPFPDPGSRFQPDGVHGPSEVIDPSFEWSDGEYPGVELSELSIYELHVGTFTAQGTFAAAADRLPYLRDLGVSAIELMPVHDFPGDRGWGYDPASFFAPSRAYGRPRDLRRLIDRAHRLGIGVLIDVVYNHFGPDGAYAGAFAPFFNDAHQTPWGAAINLDGAHSEPIREFFIENALHWLRDYHADGLRLDATFALVDDSAPHFLAELSGRVAELSGPGRLLIAEDNRHQRRLVEGRDVGGYGLHSQWADDFHHVTRRLATGDSHGYFSSVPDTPQALATIIERGWWDGDDTRGLESPQFVFCIQNHDQVGNRPMGDRLHHAIAPELYRALSALLLFCPQVPLIFMGQEWATRRPFQYFTDHEAELGRLVQKGRREELGDFPGFHGEVPDPQAESTFLSSKLHWDEHELPEHVAILQLYRDLFQRRAALSGPARATASDSGLCVERDGQVLCVGLVERATVQVPPSLHSIWRSDDRRYGGSGGAAAIEDGSVHFRVPAAIWLAP